MTKEENDMDHNQSLQNAREPLPVCNSGCLQAELNVASEDEVRRGAVPVTMTIKAWDTDGIWEGIRRLLPMPAASHEQAEVPMADLPPPDERLAKLMDDVLCTGTALALAQSLKAMGEACSEAGREGHAVLARRAERYVRTMHMHVTRFLLQPDCRLRHPSLDFDLLPAHVDVGDMGKVEVHCTDADGGGWLAFPLDELVPAGPANDAVRMMVQEVARTLVQDVVGRALAEGTLPGFDTYQQAMAGDTALQPGVQLPDEPATWGVDTFSPDGDVDGSRTVHHLQAHAEYVLGEDGPHAEPVPAAVGFDAPEGDEAFGENGS